MNVRMLLKSQPIADPHTFINFFFIVGVSLFPVVACRPQLEAEPQERSLPTPGSFVREKLLAYNHPQDEPTIAFSL